MSIRGIVFRGLGALVGGKVAEETGKSGALGGLVGFGLTALARRSPLGLVTVGGLYLGKKYLDGRRDHAALPSNGRTPAGSPIGGTGGNGDVAAATDARDPALAAGG